MKKSGLFFLLSLFLLFLNFSIFAKEVLCEASSTVKQVKFAVRDGDIIFTQKHQSINGKVTNSWRIQDGQNEEEVFADEYEKRMFLAEKEELEIAKEEEERIKQEEEDKRLLLLEQKKKEEELFLLQARLQTLKKLVWLELEMVEKSFSKLDKYDLEQYFVFEDETFSSIQSLCDVKVSLVNQARELSIRAEEDLDKDELKNVLTRLEVVPDKVERFFRQSVKYSISQCNDTRRLKELLTLI